MIVKMTEQVIKETLGEVILIGSKTSAKYDANGNKVVDVESITADLGAPLYTNATQEGASIQVKIMTTDRPNIKPLKRVKFINLVYDPYASTASMGTGVRGVLMDRFKCDGIEAYYPEDRLYDELTGEKVTGTKPQSDKPNPTPDKKP